MRVLEDIVFPEATDSMKCIHFCFFNCLTESGIFYSVNCSESLSRLQVHFLKENIHVNLSITIYSLTCFARVLRRNQGMAHKYSLYYKVWGNRPEIGENDCNPQVAVDKSIHAVYECGLCLT